VRQVFDTAKQPEAIEKPFCEGEVPLLMLSAVAVRPPEKVEVDRDPKVAAPVTPWKLSIAVVEVAVAVLVDR
jgi:hypothetical protein